MISTKRYLPLEIAELFLYQSHKIYDQFQNQYLNGLSDEIVGNCDTRMETTDVLTAQYFCGLIGVSTVETASIRKKFHRREYLQIWSKAYINAPKKLTKCRRNFTNSIYQVNYQSSWK